MPPSLKYGYQYLYFGTMDLDREAATRHRAIDSSTYSLHIMVQLARLMIHKYYIFRSGSGWPALSLEQQPRVDRDPVEPLPRSSQAQPSSSNSFRVAPFAEPHALEEYFESAEEIMSIVNRSSDTHWRYVNPFLANTIWLAAAVQLIRREHAAESSQKEMMDSNFQLLSLTYDQFVKSWGLPPALRKNLDILEQELRKLGPAGSHLQKYPSSSDSRCSNEPPTPRSLSTNDAQETPRLNKPNILHNNQSSASSAKELSSAVPTTVTRTSPIDTDHTSTKPFTSVTQRDMLPQPTSASRQYSNGAWPTITGGLVMPSGTDSSEPLLMSSANQQEQQQQRSSIENDNTYELGQPLTTLVPPFAAPETDFPPMFSADFLHAYPFPHDLRPGSGEMDFPHYLDEILSGSYMAW